MFNLKGLAKALKLQPKKLLKEMVMKHRRKYFYKFDDLWYKFNNEKELIIPFDYALQCSMKMKRKLMPPVDVNQINFSTMTSKVKKVPIVAILGHFNHGKTTLIDAYGGTNLVDKEAHAITQVVRSRMLSLTPGGQRVTFIDTPGQEIFYRMRDFGASIADMALLVIAADDGVCQQTEESIGIVESLGIPTIVCINKMDLPTVTNNKHRLKEVEDTAREYVALESAAFVAISAKEKINLGQLSSEIGAVVDKLQAGSVVGQVDEEVNGAHATYTAASPQVKALRIVGVGTVLNISRSRESGTVLHTIVQFGEVALGYHFSAGGWAGVVRSIVHDNNTALNTATEGYGVQLVVKLHPDISDPRPLGDKIFFHQPMKSLVQSREGPEFVMLQNQMENRLASHALSKESAERYRLEATFERMTRVGLTRKEEEEEEEEVEEETVEVESPENEQNDEIDPQNIAVEDTPCDFSGLVVLKADSDMSLGTLTDAHEDAVNRFQALQQGQQSIGLPRPPVQIVYAGVGEVTKRDVAIAQSARALVVAYGVGAAKEAARFAQIHKVLLTGFDCMQEAVNLLSNSSDSKELTNSLVTKPKKRDTSTD